MREEKNRKYIDLFLDRLKLDRLAYLKKLLACFETDSSNSLLFNLIRFELKKGVKQKSEKIGDEIFKMFGVYEKGSTKKIRIAFVDHSFHVKTLSSIFFIYELEKNFDVDIYWSNKWRGMQDGHIARLGKVYQYAIFWQVFPNLNHVSPKKTLIIPMWDAIRKKDDDFYKKYSDYCFICFSKELYQTCIHNNLKAKYLRFEPKIEFNDIANGVYQKSKIDPTVFFWQRNRDITWREVKKIIEGNPVSRVIICKETDPEVEFIKPSKTDQDNFNIEIISWIARHEEHEKILKEVDIYIAPRKYEGIGFSFLNAIENGCTIICNDQSTMNEYVDNEVGYLIDYNNPSYVDFSDWEKRKQKMMVRYKRENLYNNQEKCSGINSTVMSLFDDCCRG